MSSATTNGRGFDGHRELGRVLRWTATVVARDPRPLLAFAVAAALLVATEIALVFNRTSLHAVASTVAPWLYGGRLVVAPWGWIAVPGTVALAGVAAAAVLLSVGVGVARADAVLDADDGTLVAALHVAARSIPSLAAYLVVAGAVVAVGTALLVLPGIYLTGRLLAGVPATVLDGLGPIEAAREGWDRSAQRGLSTAGVVVVLLVGWIALTALPFVGVPLAVAAVGATGAAASVVVYRTA